MDVVLALLAALLFALGSVLQQKAGLDAPDASSGSSSGLILRMARKPVWLAGIAADALGFVGQAVALTIGRLAVVQPLLATSSATVAEPPPGASTIGRLKRVPYRRRSVCGSGVGMGVARCAAAGPAPCHMPRHAAVTMAPSTASL